MPSLRSEVSEQLKPGHIERDPDTFAAAVLMSNKVVAPVSIDSVARDLGISNKTIYNLFPAPSSTERLGHTGLDAIRTKATDRSTRILGTAVLLSASEAGVQDTLSAWAGIYHELGNPGLSVDLRFLNGISRGNDAWIAHRDEVRGVVAGQQQTTMQKSLELLFKDSQTPFDTEMSGEVLGRLMLLDASDAVLEDYGSGTGPHFTAEAVTNTVLEVAAA